MDLIKFSYLTIISKIVWIFKHSFHRTVANVADVKGDRKKNVKLGTKGTKKHLFVFQEIDNFEKIFYFFWKCFAQNIPRKSLTKSSRS